MPTETKQIMVRIRKGQSYILPGGAKILSLTEIDGASAESVCVQFPPTTPLINYTFFIEKRVFRELLPADQDRSLYIQKFVIGDVITSYEAIRGEGPDEDSIGLFGEGNLQNKMSFWEPLKNTPGVIAVYVCSDCSNDLGNEACNTTITLTIPQSYPVPFFVMNVKEKSSDSWFTRLYPIDPDQNGQVQREECTNKV